MTHFPAEFTGTQGCQTDGHAGLGNQREPKEITDLRRFPRNTAAGPGADILAKDTDEKVENTDNKQRYGTDAFRLVEQ